MAAPSSSCSTPPLNLAQSFTYPALDLTLIGIAATVWFRRPATQQRPLGLLLGGIAVNAMADITYQVIHAGSKVLYSSWSDAMFVAGFVLPLWGGGLYLRRPVLAPPAAGPQDRLQAPRRMPLVAAGAAAVLLLLTALHGGHGVLGVLAIGVVLLMALLVLRETLTVRESLRLLTAQVIRKTETRYEALVRHGSDLVMVMDALSVIRFASASVPAPSCLPRTRRRCSASRPGS